MARAQEKFDDVLRKMLQTPHQPNAQKSKRVAKKPASQTAKTKKPAK